MTSRRPAPDPDGHERHWPRDAPVRWSSLATWSLAWVARTVALVGQLVIGLVLVADLGLGPGPAGGGGALGQWLVALAYAALTFVTVRGWLFRRPTVFVGPIVSLALLWLTGRWPFG